MIHPFAFTFVLSSMALISACSSVNESVQPPQQATAIYSLDIAGKTNFVCQMDEQGFYWRYVGVTGQLYNGHKKIATLNNTLITHNDGSHAKLKLEKTKQRLQGNLKDALFSATSSNKGALRHVTWVQRLQIKGGMPLDTCRAVQLNQHRQISFKGRIVFWR